MDISFLVIGDLHARTSALGEFSAMAHRLIEIASSEAYDYIVLLGDLLHDHAYVHTAALNAVIGFIERLSKFPRKELMVLVGNHDLASNQCFLESRHAFNGLKNWPRVTIVDKPHRRADFIFVPYVPPGRFQEALTTLGGDWRKARAIFAHQEFRSARSGSYVSDSGDRWAKDWPLVISGHFHEYQWLAANLCYVGSPIAHQYGEEGIHTVSSFRFDDQGHFIEQRIDLGLPGRLTIECALSNIAELELDSFHKIRLIVSGEPAALASFKKTADYNRLRQSVDKLVLRSTQTIPRLAARPGATYMDILSNMVRNERKPIQELFEHLKRGDDPDEIASPERPKPDKALPSFPSLNLEVGYE